jgi:hypothetical protein
MKKLVLVLMLIALVGCERSSNLLDSSMTDGSSKLLSKATIEKAKGKIEIVWNGGNGKGKSGSDKRAFAEFYVNEGNLKRAAMGQFKYIVKNEYESIHRNIVVDVDWMETEDKIVWFKGEVISDTKVCDGCSGGSHDDGGCGGDDDDGHDDGGCGDDDDDHDDGGCGGDDDDGHDSGCSHEDSHDSGSSDHGGKGSPKQKGKNRIGQLLFMKVHDKGFCDDGTKWKWFHAESPKLPNLDDKENWHLCKKTIIDGDIRVK